MKYAAATVDSDLASEKHKNCLTKKLKKQTNIKQTKHKQEQNKTKQKQQKTKTTTTNILIKPFDTS